MSITNPPKPVAQQTPRWTLGPECLFAATVLATFAVLAGAVTALPTDFILPVASTLLLFMAAPAVLIGWFRDRRREPDRVTYWDVAGALTLIGVGAAALVDPDQMVRMFEAAPSEK
jgi:predicted benzoate:H+ symporter BenE